MRGLVLCCCLLGCGGSVRDEALVTDAAAVDSARDTAMATPEAAPVDTSVTPMVDGGNTPLTITGEGLSAYEGRTIWFLVQNRVEPGLIAKSSGVIKGGMVIVTIPGAMPPDHFGVGLDVFVDYENDGACTGMDPTWFDIVPTMWGSGTSFTFTPRPETARACADIGK